jgi:hypothetical protein
MGRLLAAVALILCATLCRGDRILVIPIDDRPATGQFAQMIANMASSEVRFPPFHLLGRFTKPGDPDAILDWLREQDLSRVDSLVISSDMLAYGGLIASREPNTTAGIAIERLRQLADVRKRNPHLKLYVFSAIMRLAPTATRNTAGWRLQLARYMQMRDQHRRAPTADLKKRLDALLQRVPPEELVWYEQTRLRNHEVQREMVRMCARSQFDYLLIGQDDASPFGPHIPERDRLRRMVDNLFVAGRVFFAEGIDQHSNVLVSRSMLKKAQWQPIVRVVYSDDQGRQKIADYESKPIEQSLRDQLLASGARPAEGDESYDYTVYVNTPSPRDPSFAEFTNRLNDEIDQSFPVAVADINIAKNGTSDPRLFASLSENGRMVKLLSYAGWNTAGNTIGTTIPAANVYLLSRKLNLPALDREIAKREFLLHRFVNDYAFHKFTRPMAYQMIDTSPTASREETYGSAFDEIDDFVKRDLRERLEQTFRSEFLNQTFFAGVGQYRVTGIEGVRIFLPWPRAYEVRLEFQLQTSPVVD